jgi:hypothetical protein
VPPLTRTGEAGTGGQPPSAGLGLVTEGFDNFWLVEAKEWLDQLSE